MSAPTPNTVIDLRRNSRRTFSVGRYRFQVPSRLKDACFHVGSAFVDGFVYLLGPFLIVFALAIISGLSYTFFHIVLPMLIHYNDDCMTWLGTIKVACHVLYVVFILINVLYNYVLCVMTRNKGKHFDQVVRELAVATGYQYPETPQQVAQAKRDYQDKMFFYTQRRQARERRQQNNNANSSSSGTVTQRQTTSNTPNNNNNSAAADSPGNERVHRWMLMGPDEWGFCHYTNQPKPPRSHYDHVTKCLVLNMDHYCPWMFNTVGFFNYRYFCNFLFFVFSGMLYGSFVTLDPFLSIGGLGNGNKAQYLEQAKHIRKQMRDGQLQTRMYPMIPLPKEKGAIAFSFMMCFAVGLAVLCLVGFHFYLVLTAQTTIEFHGNLASKRRAKKRKSKFVNPYDLGMKRNWQQVYGTMHPLLAILPSSRQPQFLPLPMAGDAGRRRHLVRDQKPRLESTRQQEQQPLVQPSSSEHIV